MTLWPKCECDAQVQRGGSSIPGSMLLSHEANSHVSCVCLTSVFASYPPLRLTTTTRTIRCVPARFCKAMSNGPLVPWCLGESVQEAKCAHLRDVETPLMCRMSDVGSPGPAPLPSHRRQVSHGMAIAMERTSQWEKKARGASQGQPTGSFQASSAVDCRWTGSTQVRHRGLRPTVEVVYHCC